MKNNSIYLKIGLIIAILIIINELSYLATRSGVGMPVLIIALAVLVGYLYYYLLNK